MIALQTFKDMVSEKINKVNATRFDGSRGMMGEFGGAGRMLARDGATIIEVPNAFDAEWQARMDEPMIFQPIGEIQYPDPCKLPSVTEQERRIVEHSITFEEAKSCDQWAVENKEGCIHDVVATSDLDLAAAAAF